MNKHLYGLSAFIFISALLAIPQIGKAVVFNPNYIVSDEELLDSKSMSPAQIQEFLKNKGGYIANYSTKNYYGETKTAAEIIYDAANNLDCSEAMLSANPTMAERQEKCKKVTINPKFLIVLLQKEMSLIEHTAPTKNQLDWAVGYGCFDNVACNERWRGFGKQVNSAALQFYDYLAHPQRYTYKAGVTYTVTNTGRPPSTITPANNATAAFYNYTPHVYNGNFNFFKLWVKYFGLNTAYPNGSLLQVKGESGVWLLQNGKRRPIQNRGALTTRFDPKKIITVSKTILETYPTGNPIKFPQYSIIRSPRGTLFLLVDDKKRGFTSMDAFRKIGYNPEEIINATWDDINAYENGVNITATTTFPTGALLQDSKTGGVFFVTDGTKAPIWDAALLKTKFKGKSIVQITPQKLASYQTVQPTIFSDGELLQVKGKPAVFVIDGGKKRAVTTGEVFEKFGYKWTNIIAVSDKILALYPEGEPITDIPEEVIVEDAPAATTTPQLELSTSTPIASTSNETSGASDSVTTTVTILPTATTTATSTSIADEVNSILNP